MTDEKRADDPDIAGSDGRPKITLAIPTFDVADTLPRVLNAVDNLTVTPQSVLCVDGGSTDGTVEIIEDHQRAERIPQEDGRSVAAARNVALEHTDTPLLAYLDADAVPESDWLQTLYETLVETRAAMCGGWINEESTTLADEWRLSHLKSTREESGRFVSELSSNNILLRTRVLEEVGGWNEGYISSEDLELCSRIREAGYGIYYNPDARVLHVRTDSPVSVVRTLWWYHLTNGEDLSSVADLPRRILVHLGKSGLYVLRDVRAGNWNHVWINLLIPPIHTYEDVKFLRSEGPENVE